MAGIVLKLGRIMVWNRQEERADVLPDGIWRPGDERQRHYVQQTAVTDWLFLNQSDDSRVSRQNKSCRYGTGRFVLMVWTPG